MSPRRDIKPPDSFLDYALYVTFFPQLVAGPIVRAADFLPQCAEPKAFSGKAIGWGLCLMLTMLLGGLWHGASWTFVIWGGLHGLYLVLERGIANVVPWRFGHRSTAQMPMALLTFLLVCVAWVFFRAHSFGQAFHVTTALFGLGPHGRASLHPRAGESAGRRRIVPRYIVHRSLRGSRPQRPAVSLPPV